MPSLKCEAPAKYAIRVYRSGSLVVLNLKDFTGVEALATAIYVGVMPITPSQGRVLCEAHCLILLHSEIGNYIWEELSEEEITAIRMEEKLANATTVQSFFPT